MDRPGPARGDRHRAAAEQERPAICANGAGAPPLLDGSPSVVSDVEIEPELAPWPKVRGEVPRVGEVQCHEVLRHWDEPGSAPKRGAKLQDGADRHYR